VCGFRLQALLWLSLVYRLLRRIFEGFALWFDFDIPLNTSTQEAIKAGADYNSLRLGK
jgi:hypothetical protein